MGVVVLRGNCPTNRGNCPIGVVVLRVNVPRDSCPRGELVGGSCPVGVIVPGVVFRESHIAFYDIQFSNPSTYTHRTLTSPSR